MTSQSQLSPKPEISYFGLQAYTGTTKHLGGFATTKDLIELCHIDGKSYVLEVGCGVGATTCYLAKRFGIGVVGVDLRQGMIARAEERAKREGVEDRVEFQVADAQQLPFEDDQFDAVLCESVATFIEDKKQVIEEFARVVKPGGYAGLNEEIWLQPPPPDLVDSVERLWEVKATIPTADGWQSLLAGAGFEDIIVQPLKFNTRREATQIKRYRLADLGVSLYRTLDLYLKNLEFRAYMKKRSRLPKDVFQYLGYGLFVGRKPR